MRVSAEDIRRQYAELSDEGLLEMDRQELVEMARQCYDEEVARRGLKTGWRARVAAPRAPEPVASKPATRHALEPPSPAAKRPAPEPPAPELDDEDEELVVAETYDSPEAARLARELLRTSGIRARLGDDGMEVLVPASAEEAAQAVLISEISDETMASALDSTSPGWLRQGRGCARACLYGNAGLLEFIHQVFGARELERFELGPDSVRVDALIGDSVVSLEMAEPPAASAVPASVYVYVPDVDARYSRAIQNGAEEIAPPEDKPYGERVAAVRDAFGNTWWMATYQAS